MKYLTVCAALVCFFSQCKSLKINQEEKMNGKIFDRSIIFADTCLKSKLVSVDHQNVQFKVKDTTFCLNPYNDLDSVYSAKALKAYFKIYPENESKAFLKTHSITFSILGPNYAINLKISPFSTDALESI
jgi:hypothetical protein